MGCSSVSVYDCIGKTELTSVMAEATQDTESTDVYFKQKPKANLSGVIQTRAGWINQTRLSMVSEAGSKKQSQNLKFVQLAYT